MSLEFMPLASQHEASLKDFLQDFADHGEPTINGYFADRTWPHARIVQAFVDWTRGEGLPTGWVPCHTVFAVEDGCLLGVYNIRYLGQEELARQSTHVGYSVRPSARGRGVATAMLADAQRFASDYGMQTLALTCGEANPASRRVIEKRGGVLVERYPENDRITLRFVLPTQFS